VSHQPLRIIDANLNRSREGLRVLEDVARFLLDDAELSRGLRILRHDLARQTKSLRIELLSVRDAEHDVGHPSSAYREKGKRGVDATPLANLPDLITANSKRVEESLRVLEELAKLPELSPMLDLTDFEQARFTLYVLERELISRISRRDKAQKICGLYVILDRQFLAGRDELEVAEQIIEGGARVIQLRDKQTGKGELLFLARKLKELCSRAGVLFVVNDYLDLAVAAKADGLHIGQSDLPVSVVREQLPLDKIVGCSVTTAAQAVRAQTEGVDYIAVGSVFPTTTKKEITMVGVDILKELKQTVSIPVVAIGGINRNNIGEVLAAGADAIAVISAVLGEEDAMKAAQELAAKMDLGKAECQSQ
jgi:thiamine-phosphate pyrophosphorylase